MTSQRSDRPGTPNPTRVSTQPWEAGRQALFAGQRQTQEFWNSMARSWGQVTGAWLGQFSRSSKSIEVLREWQEAGVWQRLHELLLARLNEADRIDWSRAAIDSSHVRAFGGAPRPARARSTAPGAAPSTT